MSVQNLKVNSAYGLDEALTKIFPRPIVSRRSPTVRDVAPIGQMWVNRVLNTAFVLVDVTANQALWSTVAVPVVGNLNVAGDVIAGTGLTVTGGGADVTGNLQVTGNITATGTLDSLAGGITVTAGDVTLTNGELILTAATTGITLPGPTRIMNGAGVPANGLAINVGDIYIRTDAAAAVERIYIATAAATWTNVTCAA